MKRNELDNIGTFTIDNLNHSNIQDYSWKNRFQIVSTSRPFYYLPD